MPRKLEHTNAGHIPTNFNEYPEHIQERLSNCGKYMSYNSLDGKKGWYQYSCNLKVCPKCGGYRTKNAIDAHFYEELKEEDWHKLTIKLPKAQTKADVDAFYKELGNVEEMLKGTVKYAEIFQVNATGDEENDRIVAYIVPKFASTLINLEGKGTVKHVKKYVKEIKKTMQEHVNLSDNIELNKYMLKLTDEKGEGKAFKKRVRKIGLRGNKVNDAFIKVPTTNFAGKDIAVVKDRKVLQNKAEGNEVKFDAHEHPLYPVLDENGEWIYITFKELQTGRQEGKYTYEWHQYFPQGRLKKAARCNECKANIRDAKVAGYLELLIKLRNEDMEKLSPSSQICEQTGLRCDFCIRHRKGHRTAS